MLFKIGFIGMNSSISVGYRKWVKNVQSTMFILLFFLGFYIVIQITPIHRSLFSGRVIHSRKVVNSVPRTYPFFYCVHIAQLTAARSFVVYSWTHVVKGLNFIEKSVSLFCIVIGYLMSRWRNFLKNPNSVIDVSNYV